MLNHIDIVGRMTRDPELRTMPTGANLAIFTVAVERDFGNRESGEKITDFIDCVAWRQTGEFVTRNGQKGRLVAVTGRLQSRKWQDKEGNNRTSWEISADNVYFLDSRRESQGAGGYSGNSSYSNNSYSNSGSYGSYDGGRQSSAPAASTFSELDDGDGELPF